MKVCFVTNYFNHLQSQCADAIYRITSGNYAYIETRQMRVGRKNMGWSIEAYPDYVIDNSINPKDSRDFINDSDVIMIGSASDKLVRAHIRTGKLLFRYSERPLEKGIEPLKYLPRLIKWHLQNPMCKPIYMLCASAYTAADYAKFGLFINRTYKWGYFPELKTYDDVLSHKDPSYILWVGRFIECKHPEVPVKIAKRLKDDGYQFTLDIIGRGILEGKILSMIKNEGLEDRVQLLGAMHREQVREHMEKAGVYLFTSDFNEGWGAVLNESMNSGCAVVASHAAGATPYLIKHKENGLIYENGNIDDLYNKVKYLLDRPAEQKMLGKNAYLSIRDLWNAEVAAERFIKLAEEIIKNGSCDLYKEGPCSRAEIIKNNWFKSDEL